VSQETVCQETVRQPSVGHGTGSQEAAMTDYQQQTSDTPGTGRTESGTATADTSQPRVTPVGADPARYAAAGPTDQRPVSGWWAGWVWFAALMLVVLGIFNVIDGLVALLRDNFFTVDNGQLVVWNLTAWGWIHLIFGALQIVAGVFLFSGNTLARIAAIVLTGLNAIAQLAFVGAYPVWSIIIIAIDVIVLWALIMHGRDLAQAW
jgi:hypothetical protein